VPTLSKRNPLAPALAALGALATLGIAACADAGSALPGNLSCIESRDCDPGLGCSFNHCVVPEANRISLAARIIPPPTSGLLPQQIPSLRLEDGPDRLVKLLAPTIVRGTVKPGPANNGLSFVTNLEGELELRTDGDIPGLDFVFSAHSLEGLDTEGFGYTLTLLPGRSYTGSFRPTDRTLPRHIFRLEPSDIAKGRFDITLPAQDDYLKLGGRVMKSDYTPIGGARIVVLSTHREVAAITTSEPKRGLWEVLVPPGLTSFFIKTESPNDGTVFPDFSTEMLTYVANRQIDLIVPDLAPGTEPVQAVIRVTERKTASDALAPAIVPAVGRTVTIVGVLAGGTLRRSGTTNELGEVTFNALPGAYECLVASPPQAAAATWHAFVNIASWSEGNNAEVVSIELVPRVPFVGHVTDAFGMPVEAGTLTLERRIDGTEGDALFVAPAPFEAELGADGVFVTAVDPGTYDLLVAPDPSTGAPHTFETELVVGPEGLRFDLGLPPPGLLHLTVAGPDGDWISGAQVELWIDDELGSPRLLAVGSTTDDGFVDMIVPHLGDLSPSLIEWQRGGANP